MPAPLTSQVPLLQRGGSILPLRERVRRAAELGWRDPFTLIIALNKPSGSSSDSTLRAQGKLYLDDGDTYAFESGDFIWRKFEWHTTSSSSSHTLTSKDQSSIPPSSPYSTSTSQQISSIVKKTSNGAFVEAISSVRIEKIVVLGLDKSPKSVKVGSDSIPFTWTNGVSASGSLIGSGTSSELIVKDPKVLVVQDWDIQFE